MKSCLFDIVRRRFRDPAEVAEYERRAREEGLLDWEKAVVSEYLWPPGRLLDIGCGAGREAFALYDMGYDVVGIDISEELVESASNAAQELRKPVELQTCNGTQLDFPDCSFHYVVIWGQALGNVPGRENREVLMRECRRVLKPGGRLAFSVHNRDVCERIARDKGLIAMGHDLALQDGDLILRGDSASDTPCYWHYFTGGEALSLSEQAGLSVIKHCLARDLGQADWDTIRVVVCERKDACQK